MSQTEMYSISELARHFEITTRTIRYYEEIGLLTPHRSEGGQRLFSKKEKARLQLVFRGKKYGFSLDEIRDMIQLFDQDPSGRQQLERTIQYGKEKIEEVSSRIEDLVQIRSEMEQYIVDFQEKLSELERDKDEYA
ncbi:mercuric resistance operon regulatory protein [Oceanobacillus picturae]|jgi:DNA-binding transcriptional MerR regulator|uniref:Mercuric resistance operon regulatory protein n=1 Tax=Oceanobacillus picturae TaxID=171693 RepID=W9BA39_9BACI|nr:MerR family DNA-binding transcriptional regulator [Oceanobacillus picturae]RIU91202.1 MerR family DNA-binding transcriptional regulator [Oceanobacillus picturae]GAQ16176.1 mercuric resistance operon regulatory protein [Oceanobacillus picturae]CDO03360.1 Mercuric resistance operon regulatory protein [Oceanobacillus picturae]